MDEIDHVARNIDSDEVIEFCRQLIKIRSVATERTGEEAEISQYIAERLKGWGIRCELQEVEPGRMNAIGYLDGSGQGPTLMLNGHVDTVTLEGMEVNPLGAELHNGKIYGRGSADMKAGVASMIMAMKAVNDAGVPLKGRLVVAAVADEEIGGKGSAKLREADVGTDFGIVTEPTDLEVCLAHTGMVWYDIHAYGRAAHGSTPELGVNAIAAMAIVIEELRRLQEILRERLHPLVGSPTICIGRIKGGTQPNIVADHCHLEVDRRLIPGETPSAALQELRTVLEKAQRKFPDISFTIEPNSMVKLYEHPVECTENELVARALKEVCELVLRKSIEFKGVPYGTDASIISSPPLNIKTCVFGPGSITQAHTSTEHVSVDQLIKCTEILALTICRICG